MRPTIALQPYGHEAFPYSYILPLLKHTYSSRREDILAESMDVTLLIYSPNIQLFVLLMLLHTDEILMDNGVRYTVPNLYLSPLVQLHMYP